MRVIGWKPGTPDSNRKVKVLRVLNDGSRVHWVCRFYKSEGRWATCDGIYICDVLGWREIK